MNKTRKNMSLINIKVIKWTKYIGRYNRCIKNTKSLAIPSEMRKQEGKTSTTI